MCVCSVYSDIKACRILEDEILRASFSQNPPFHTEGN